MIFSRYAGVGSHRYPIGFSGDTLTTWRSLDFQPYFTAMASNIGYGWWSHDIGGHMLGDKDNERLIRWIQYGVFSPIMRIHSSNSPFFNKEPWNLDEPYRSIMGNYMRLRHKLVPYIYTSMYEAYAEDKPVIQPMYYKHPDDKESYEAPNAYYFGSSLLVAAITEPMDSELRMASASCYIPEGRWVDIFTGTIYEGGVKRKLYRSLDSIPVLIKAGGIVPMASDVSANGTDNPVSLRILIGAGESGEYELYEDDGVSMAYKDGKQAVTKIRFDWNEADKSCSIKVEPVVGDSSLIPKKRDYEFVLCGAAIDEESNGYAGEVVFDEKTGFPIISVSDVEAADGLNIGISGISFAENDKEAAIFGILDRAWIKTTDKELIYAAFKDESDTADFASELASLDVSEKLKDAIREISS